MSFYSFSQTWVQQGLGWNLSSVEGVMNISIVSPQIVWVAASDGSGGGLAVQDFSRTVNGGTTWTPGKVNNATGLSNSMITAINADTAWMAMYKVSGSNSQGVYKTTDGGTTWTRQATAPFSGSASFPDWIYFWDANNGIVLGDPINNEFEIYTTSNGGTQWTLLPSANIPAPTSGETGYTSNFSVVGDHIWFGTAKGRVYASSDRGQHWTVATPPNFAGKNSYPAFKDSVNGLAIKFYTAADTLNLLDASSDGGATYTAVSYHGSVLTGDIKAVPGSANTYVTTGWDGTNQGTGRMGVTYSFNGGNTWITDAAINGTGLTCSSWLNDSTGWIGAFNSGTADGIYKFNGVLAPPVSNFMTPDTLIALGGSATFTNLSTGSPTSYAWTFTGGTPASSTAKNPPAIHYNTPGTYNVKLVVTSDFGSNTLTKTNYIHVGGVGINELNQNIISVYPNPVKDMMTVQANSNIKEIYIYNMTGQLVLNQVVSSNKVNVTITGLSSGIYSLKAILDNGTITKKIVIQ
jgi:PKD repeat protein